MKAYPTYKDSGIEWIGEIPEHWKISKLRYLGTCQNGISAGADYFGSGFPFLSYGDVYNNRVIPNDLSGLVQSSQTDQERYSVQKGDVFFTRTSETIEEIGIASTCITSIEAATFAGFLIRFRPNNNDLFEGFSKYYFRSDIQRKFFVSKMNLVTRASLGQDLLKDHPVFLIPLEEQQQIARFLDKKTSEVIKSINGLNKYISLLIEERKSLIQEAVTQGLKLGVQKKDHGIEWASQVPNHWKKIKLRYLADITTGNKDTENKVSDGKYPFFVRSQTIERIDTFSYNGEAILTAGDGAVCKIWHYINGKFDFHQRVYKVFNFKSVLGKFLYYFMMANFIHEVLKLSAKTTVDSLRRPMFLDFPVMVPPLKEQQQIVQYIESETSRIDQEIAATQKEIELLGEYRQALIAEAVTGKIDVRDYVLED